MSDNNPRTPWGVGSEFSNKAKKLGENIVIKKGDQTIENPFLIVTELNNFFIEAPQVLVQSINVEDYNINCSSNIGFDYSEMELLKLLLKKLKSKNYRV